MYNNKITSNYVLEDLHSVSIKWIDIEMLKSQDENDDSMFEYIWYGTSNMKFWHLFIPVLNIIVLAVSTLYLITSPYRLHIKNRQMKNLLINAYDVEDTKSLIKIIRNKNKKYGICIWGKTFRDERKVLLESIFFSIKRYTDSLFIVVDSNNKYGVYSTNKDEWTLLCNNDKIFISKEGYLVVVNNDIHELYNREGYRIVK